MLKIDRTELYIGPGDLPGASAYGKDWHFTCVAGKCRSLCLNLYDVNGELYDVIDMHDYHVSGNVYSVVISSLDKNVNGYAFYADDELIGDVYCKRKENGRAFGDKTRSLHSDNISLLYRNDFDWGEDRLPSINYKDCIMYSLHVRGFTKHSSSGVKNKGTFLGLTEKIPYFQELAVNQIEIMPAYDFDELDKCVVSSEYRKQDSEDEYRINYWGFKGGNYFMPKSSYALRDSVSEFKTMVKLLHENGIEVIMQFFFPNDFNRNLIIPVLRFWARDYHVDGFHIMGESVPVMELVTDPMLIDRKIILNSGINTVGMEDRINPFVAVIQRDFSDTVRRFVKSDENMLVDFLRIEKSNPKIPHRINYITSHEGFTLNDLVSYDYKHNEDNGEDNRDGTSVNHSWNCGIEGDTKKKSVNSLRIKQMKNLFSMLLLSASVPMILAGDEMLNSQNGNNNAYCHDSDITWINWRMNSRKSELFEFVKKLIEFRRLNPVIHLEEEHGMMDSLSCGYPDLSYHGEEAWYLKSENFVRQVGMMYCGLYGKSEQSNEFIYVAYNMHWKPHDFALPKLPKGFSWRVLLETADSGDSKGNVRASDKIIVKDRSVMILVAQEA